MTAFLATRQLTSPTKSYRPREYVTPSGRIASIFWRRWSPRALSSIGCGLLALLLMQLPFAVGQPAPAHLIPNSPMGRIYPSHYRCTLLANPLVKQSFLRRLQG